MATDQSEVTMDDSGIGQNEETSEPPGIAHLTVVPENADPAS